MGNDRIGYDIIMGHYQMAEPGLKDDFGHQILEWGYTIVLMKDTGILIVKQNLTQQNMQEVVIHTA